MSVLLCISCVFSVFLFSCCLQDFPCFIKQVPKARRVFDEGRERLECANQIDEQLPETKLDTVISICVNEGYALYHVAHYPPHDDVNTVSLR